MKASHCISLAVLLGTAVFLTAFSPQARAGAAEGLALAENTVIPSLLPLLIIFLLIMKTGAKDVLAKLLGKISFWLFRLPYVSFPAVMLGLAGGYPTGALLTYELYKAEEIDEKQAQRMVCFNFCGGCGFIITAVGSYLKCQRAGVLLYASNVISGILLGVILSIRAKKPDDCCYSFTQSANVFDKLSEAVSSAVSSVLNMTAYIILFSAVNACISIPERLSPLIEITNGIFGGRGISIPLLSAYLAFGGLCIHFQLLSVLREIKLSYLKFFICRTVCAFMSFFITKGLLFIFPVDVNVFSSSAVPVEITSINYGLSALLVLGCFVIVSDLNSRKKII